MRLPLCWSTINVSNGISHIRCKDNITTNNDRYHIKAWMANILYTAFSWMKIM